MILVDVTNGMAEQNVDKSETNMIITTGTGFINLLKISKKYF